MEFSRSECRSGQPFPSPGDLPNPGIKPRSPTLQEDSLPSEPSGKPKNTGVGSLFLLPGDLPDPGIKPGSPSLQAGSLPVELPRIILIKYDSGCLLQRTLEWVAGASLVAQLVKNPPATRETWVQPLGWEDPLEEGMKTHSNIFAWRIPQ